MLDLLATLVTKVQCRRSLNLAASNLEPLERCHATMTAAVVNLAVKGLPGN
jgi:hypothetical protein